MRDGGRLMGGTPIQLTFAPVCGSQSGSSASGCYTSARVVQ